MTLPGSKSPSGTCTPLGNAQTRPSNQSSTAPSGCPQDFAASRPPTALFVPNSPTRRRAWSTTRLHCGSSRRQHGVARYHRRRGLTDQRPSGPVGPRLRSRHYPGLGLDLKPRPAVSLAPGRGYWGDYGRRSRDHPASHAPQGSARRSGSNAARSRRISAHATQGRPR